MSDYTVISNIYINKSLAEKMDMYNWYYYSITKYDTSIIPEIENHEELYIVINYFIDRHQRLPDELLNSYINMFVVSMFHMDTDRFQLATKWIETNMGDKFTQFIGDIFIEVVNYNDNIYKFDVLSAEKCESNNITRL